MGKKKLSRSRLEQTVSKEKFDAVLFDMDGVLTATAKVHAVCWKKMLDEFLKKHAEKTAEPFRPFDIETDYKLYVDGKLRYEGVKSFTESRGIDLPYGDPEEPPSYDTVCGLGNMKDKLVKEVLDTDGVDVYEGSVDMVRSLIQQSVKTAVVSASKICITVLKDGEVAERFHLAGKPAPDTYLEAAKELGVEAQRAVVIEDAISGVQAGRNGNFGLVIGVARKGNADELRENGADIVVGDLGELL
jgi:beta-phosphoglucomutase-like phosphatase (HAD superfamily)